MNFAVDPAKIPMRAAERIGRLLLWVGNQSDLTRQERAVLHHLILAGDENLASYWSHERIGEAIGWGRTAVCAAVQGLSEKKLIRRQERFHLDGTRATDRVVVRAPVELRRARSNRYERAAVDHDADLEYGSVIGTPETEQPMDSGCSETEQELSTSLSIEEVSESSARRFRNSRSTKPLHGQPHRLSLVDDLRREEDAA